MQQTTSTRRAYKAKRDRRSHRLCFENCEARLVLDSTVVFNEVMYHPPDENLTEWVELYNQHSVDMDLTSWRITGGIEYSFPQGTVLPGGGYLVIAKQPAQLLEQLPGEMISLGPFEGGISDGGERIELRSRTDRLMDALEFEDDDPWPVGSDGSGHSLSKIDEDNATANPTNWETSILSGGTPGSSNQKLARDPGTLIEFITRRSESQLLIPTVSDAGKTWTSPEFEATAWQTVTNNLGFDTSGFESGTLSRFYPLDSNTIDATGNSEPGTLNSPTYQSAHPARLEGGQSLHFDGQDDVVTINDPVSPTAYTISTWVRFDEIKQQSIILRSFLSPTLLWSHQLRLNQDGLFEAHTFDGARITVTGHTVAEPDRWYHIATSAESNGELRLYVDGIAEGAPAQLNTLRDNTTEWQLGVASGGSYGFLAGSLDEVAIFSDVLNFQQIKALAAGARPSELTGITHLFESDIEAQMHSVNSTAWIRTQFNVPQHEYYDQLSLSIQYDDGFVAYLNGKPVASRNAPPATDWTSASTDDGTPASGFETIDLMEHIDAIRAGENVLAVHGLNQTASDSDFLISTTLTGRTADSLRIPTAKFNEAAGIDDETFWIELTNTHSTPISINGYRIASSTGRSYTIQGAPQLAPGDYYVLDENTLEFDATNSTRLFLHTAKDQRIADAITIRDRLRGIDERGKWQYPSVGTPGGANRFDIEEDIVINEIMYHARPTYASPSAEPEELITTLLPAGANGWRYRESALGLPVGWAEQQHPVDEDEWFLGQAPIGYHIELLENLNTELTVPFLQRPGIDTYYFETEFNVAEIPISSTLKLSHTIDDGAIFFLNGQEIFRHNLRAGQIDGSVRAETEIFTPTGQDETILNATALQVGTNRLSVEIHQALEIDPDIYLDAELSLQKPLTGANEYAASNEEWIELYNRGDQLIDLSGWKLNHGVRYSFPSGTNLEPKQFLVISNAPSQLTLAHGIQNVIGPFQGSLRNSNDTIELLDAQENIVDTVEYFDDGRWPNYADGGGSSLELQDPRADNSIAESWTASQEGSKSQWAHYEYTRTVERFPYDPPIHFNEFIFGLLDSGEMLVDNVSVIEDPGGINKQLIQNGSFESDIVGEHAEKWRLIGNHRESQVVIDPANPSNRALRLVAQSKSHYLSNHAETTLVDNTRVRNGNTYRISFDAKWIAGTAQLRSELYHKDAARTTILTQPSLSGTPGQTNSNAIDNQGPSYTNLLHHPPIPKSTEDVTVSIQVADPDGLSSVNLFYSVADGEQQQVRMTQTPEDTYEALIPAQNNRSITQFYVEATDQQGASTTFPSDGINSRALFRVDDRFERDELRHNIMVIMTDADRSELQSRTNMMDNYRYGSTVIYDAKQIFYDVGTRYKGSMFTRNSRSTVGFNLRFDPEQKFRGVHETISFDQKNEREIQVKHLIAQGGLMGAMFDDVTIFQPPGATRGLPTLTTMAGQRNIYLDSQFENGSQGTFYKLEGIRVMQQTIDRDPESLKIYQPIGWVPALDVRDLGDNKEVYRWPFLILNNRARDDYAPIMELAKTFELQGDELKSAITEVIDVDQWMQTLAMMSVAGIADVFGQAEENPHNVNFYVNPENNKILLFPWDWDFSFQIPTNAPLTGKGKAIHKVVRLPRYERLLYGHLLHITDTVGNSDYMNPWAEHFGDLLRESFRSTGSYLDRRGSSIRSQIQRDFPAIDFRVDNDGPLTVDSDQLTLTGQGWVNIRTLRIAGKESPLDVTWDVQTGQNADHWQTTLPVPAGTHDIILQAYDYNDDLIASQTIQVTSTLNSSPVIDSLRITEVNYNPHEPLTHLGELATNNEAFEFVELTNIGSVPINLAGVEFAQTIVDGSPQGIRFLFDAQTLDPQQRVVIVNDRNAFESRYGTDRRIALGDSGNGRAGEFGGRLSNGGEQITLLDPHGVAISQFTYDDQELWPQRADGNASSLIVVDTNGDYNDAANWQNSISFGGSPGAAPTPSKHNIVINEIQPSTTAPSVDQIELFNNTNHPIDIQHWYLSDSNNDYFKYTFRAATVIEPQGYLVLDQAEFGFGFNSQSPDDAWLIEADNTGRPQRFADHVVFGVTEPQQSFGRWPNGTGAITKMPAPTFGQPNRAPTTAGDFNSNGSLDHNDIERICGAIRANATDPSYDLNQDRSINLADLFHLIEVEFSTSIGDANLDLIFDSSDLVSVFQAGTYEDKTPNGSTWKTGDWNCDGNFNSSDLVTAFQRGRYADAERAAHIMAAQPSTAAAVQPLPEKLQDHRKQRQPIPGPLPWFARPLVNLPMAEHHLVFAENHDWQGKTLAQVDELESILNEITSTEEHAKQSQLSPRHNKQAAWL